MGNKKTSLSNPDFKLTHEYINDLNSVLFNANGGVTTPLINKALGYYDEKSVKLLLIMEQRKSTSSDYRIQYIVEAEITTDEFGKRILTFKHVPSVFEFDLSRPYGKTEYMKVYKGNIEYPGMTNMDVFIPAKVNCIGEREEKDFTGFKRKIDFNYSIDTMPNLEIKYGLQDDESLELISKNIHYANICTIAFGGKVRSSALYLSVKENDNPASIYLLTPADKKVLLNNPQMIASGSWGTYDYKAEQVSGDWKTGMKLTMSEKRYSDLAAGLESISDMISETLSSELDSLYRKKQDSSYGKVKKPGPKDGGVK